MNQNKKLIKLLNYTIDDHPFGNVQGKNVFRKLSDYIDSHPMTNIFGISLAGIEATDASFPRESVISIAKQYHGSKWFYLESVNGRDLIDNWDYAAEAKNQPLIIWNDDKFELIGPKLSHSNLELFNYIITNTSVTTSKVANNLNLSVPNASTKLKKLYTQGYIVRSEEVAESGGIEFIYHSIK